MARPIKSFRGLKVGDRVRLVQIPSFYRVGYNNHRDTMWVYRQVFARRRPMRICLIDEWGLPYVHCAFGERTADGGTGLTSRAGRWSNRNRGTNASERRGRITY